MCEEIPVEMRRLYLPVNTWSRSWQSYRRTFGSICIDRFRDSRSYRLFESIKSNYCETKGIHKDINVFKLLLVLIGFKSKELEKAIEESVTDKKKDNESDK